MTKEEASKNYRIPVEILDEYESWGLCGSIKQAMGHWQYDDQDLERLSLIMNILNALRDRKLDEIHLKEKQVERLDYLRYKLRRQGAKG